MFQASVCASYSPTSRFVMNAGATMNNTTPMTRPSTMENAISFLPNTASPSDFGEESLAAAAEAPSAEAGSETTSSERCAPKASIMVSGRPKSSFQENGASAGPDADTGASPAESQADEYTGDSTSASPASECGDAAAPTPAAPSATEGPETAFSSAPLPDPEASACRIEAVAFSAIPSEPTTLARCEGAGSAPSSSSSLNAWSAAISSAL